MLKIDLKSCVILVIGLIVGIVFGYLFGSGAKTQAYQMGLERGRLEIEEKYQRKIEEIFPPMPELEEIFSASGQITNIQDKTLALEEIIYPASPFEEPRVRKWQVEITDSTELVKRIEKTPEEMAKEEAISEEIPLPFKEIEIEFSAFEKGQEVIAESEENIKGKAVFEAQKIIVQPVLMTP